MPGRRSGPTRPLTCGPRSTCKLGEHLILAAKATGAALAGDDDAVPGVRWPAQHQRHRPRRDDRLGLRPGGRRTPSTRSGAPTTGSSWTTRRASRPTTRRMQDEAVEDLTEQYVPQFSELIAERHRSAARRGHAAHHRPRAPDQGRRRRPGDRGLGRRLRRPSATAYAHMQMIGDALAAAIVGAASRHVRG